ncbi:MAG: hypoxanthine phosphoribosyltransferase [Phycisphaerales bacterium]|nr:hypoxanthine phosphoribosyltransferase [Phycisphaerae bacterium]NNF43143.1 hypoxanthine phosphoribosyltransferase [Phycisphaerales bacterium]NNM27423.1 hypoxanthine phosphoribosyltransferase [Phycisphaerales bacterium]
MVELHDSGTDTLRHVLGDVERILIDRGRIADRIESLGREISADLAAVPGDVEVILIPILTGSIIFVADLIRHLPQKFRISVLAAQSYPGRRTESVGVPVLGVVPDDLAGKFVLIVDDILDSGGTISRIRAELEQHNPRAVRVCVLLRKQRASALTTACDYVGFDIPDDFVVGYGLDYDGYYRNLPDIGVLKKEAL